MSVLIEAISVVVKKDATEERFPGGPSSFAENAPNQTYCEDGSLVGQCVNDVFTTGVSRPFDCLIPSGYLVGVIAVNPTIKNQQDRRLGQTRVISSSNLLIDTLNVDNTCISTFNVYN